MKNTSKFQNVVIVTIVGWLVLFVFLPNLMIIGTSFLTRDDASFVKMVFTLDNYTRLLDPLYFEVLLHSLNMALIATLACLVLGYPFAWFLAKLPHKVRPLLLFLLIVPFWTNSMIRIYGLKIFLSTKGYLNEFLLHGEVDISNNIAENAIRPFVVGRKNWLFCDTPKGAEASAVVYTLVETAKANGLDPFRYLNYVLTNIRFLGQNPSNAELEEFLPWRKTIQAECQPKLS